MAELGTKGQELATMAQYAMKNLKGDDLTKFTKYMTTKAEEFQALATKLV